MFLYEITHRFLKKDYQCFINDTLKTKDHKIRGNYNLLMKVKFHKLERSSEAGTQRLWKVNLSVQDMLMLHTHGTRV